MPTTLTAKSPILNTTAKKSAAYGSVAAAIIAGILAVEGGYVAHQDDPGKATNLGITEKVAREHGYQGSMKTLPKATAEDIYRQDYIVKPGYEPFLMISPAVASELVDSAVNIGADKPNRWLQTALNALSQRGELYGQIPIDGKVGPGTVKAYADLQKVRGKVQACELIIKSLDAQQATYYLTISLSNPRLQSFTTGWLSNRIGNVPLSRCSE
jgi:lysozyme family protein